MEKHGDFPACHVMLVFRGCNRGKISYLLTSYLLKRTEEFLLAHPTEDPVRFFGEELVEKFMLSLFSRCWWFQRFFIFTDEHIVQMAWNHQPGFLLKSKTWYTGVTDVSMTKPTDLILTSVSLIGITKFQLDLINWSVGMLTRDSFIVAMENQLTELGNSQIRNQSIDGLHEMNGN